MQKAIQRGHQAQTTPAKPQVQTTHALTREMLFNFYTKHNPAKLDKVDHFFARYPSEIIVSKLSSRYGASPLDAEYAYEVDKSDSDVDYDASDEDEEEGDGEDSCDIEYGRSDDYGCSDECSRDNEHNGSYDETEVKHERTKPERAQKSAKDERSSLALQLERTEAAALRSKRRRKPTGNSGGEKDGRTDGANEEAKLGHLIRRQSIQAKVQQGVPALQLERVEAAASRGKRRRRGRRQGGNERDGNGSAR